MYLSFLFGKERIIAYLPFDCLSIKMKFASATKVIWELAHKGLVAARCRRQRIFSPSRLLFFTGGQTPPPTICRQRIFSPRAISLLFGRANPSPTIAGLFLLSTRVIEDVKTGRRGRRPLQIALFLQKVSRPLYKLFVSCYTINV